MYYMLLVTFLKINAVPYLISLSLYLLHYFLFSQYNE